MGGGSVIHRIHVRRPRSSLVCDAESTRPRRDFRSWRATEIANFVMTIPRKKGNSSLGRLPSKFGGVRLADPISGFKLSYIDQRNPGLSALRG